MAAGVLASEAHHWRRAVAGLESVWANFHVSQVFYADRLHMLRGGLHWLISLISGGMVLAPPKALLDNDPAVGSAEDQHRLGRRAHEHRARSSARARALLDELCRPVSP